MSRTTDYRETLVTYLRSESLDDAARNLGVSKPTLNARLGNMRKAGINIPKLSRPEGLSSSLYIAQLNALVNKYNKEK